MDKVFVADKEVTVRDAAQILNMGGPWVGKLYIEDEEIAENALAGNFIYRETDNLLFFIKYHLISRYWYFSINFYSLKTKTLQQFDKEFDMVYLGKFISKNELEIYHAFHDKYLSNKQIFNLDNEDFYQV